MRKNKKTNTVVSRFVRAAMAGVLAVGLAPLPAFADELQAGEIAAGDAMATDGYVIAAAFAAAEPAPELLGLNNPNFRNTGEADNIGAMFGSSDVNENPDPYVYNYMNGKTPGIYIGGRSGMGPMAGLSAYDSSDDTAPQNAVWKLKPHIILGTGADAIPENEHDFYNTEAYARAAETANGWEENSYNPIGVTYNRVSLPTMIQTMYRLANAAEETLDGDTDLKTRYESPLEIAKDYERYIVGQKGVVKQAIDSGKVRTKTIALVESYDSDAATYTIITDGVAEGTATTNRYLEAVQGVTKNYYDTVGETGASTVTKDQLKNDVDVIIVGGNAGTDAGSLADYLTKDGLIAKTYYCVNWANGSVFGTTVNSVENAQNIGRILPCVYPEVLDQSDMVAYYYDVFYHIKDGKIADMIAERMDGVRNWAHVDSASLTAWETSDYTGYNHDKVESLITSGIAYLNSQSGLSDYLAPSSYLSGDKDILEPAVETPQAVITVEQTTVAKKYGDEAFAIGATTSREYDGTLSYASSDENVVTVDASGQATIKGVGTATIKITGTDAAYYQAPESVDVTVTVAKKGAKQTITTSADSFAKTYGDASFSIGAKTSGDGALSYTSGNTDVATVAKDGSVTIKNAGTANITVTAAETDTYAKSTKTVKVTVAKKAQTITASNKSVAMGKTAKIAAKANGGGAVSYATSNAKVAKVSDKGVVTPVKVGTAKITITAAAKGNYAKATKTITVTVKQGTQKLTFSKQSKNVKLSAVKKAEKVVSIAKAKGAKTTVTYAISKVNKSKSKFSINKKTGKITVKKGIAKGTYKVTVKATAKKTANYAGASKSAVITIKVK